MRDENSAMSFLAVRAALETLPLERMAPIQSIDSETLVLDPLK